jgi:tetratricopeptide (TPR) repeat protein
VRWLRPVLLLAGMLAAAAPAVRAHGDLHELIARASKDIAANPHDASRYLARAELYRAHHEPQRALTDYARALELDPDQIVVHLARGHLLLDQKQPRRAMRDLDRFLTAMPAHAEAHLLRARARAATGARQNAVADYDDALALAPQPDWAIERARIVLRGSPAQLEAAVHGLEEVSDRLGSVPTLHLEAVAMARRAGRHEMGLAVVDRLLATCGTTPRWLTLRGELLMALQRHAEARIAFTLALRAIDQLPPARQITRQMTTLRARIQRFLI